MKKSKSKNKSDLNNNQKLVKMFEDQIPEDRQQVLRDIDSIMCNMLELQPDDLPWINPNKHEEKWENLMNNLRLIVGRIEYASKQKKRTGTCGGPSLGRGGGGSSVGFENSRDFRKCPANFRFVDDLYRPVTFATRIRVS